MIVDLIRRKPLTTFYVLAFVLGAFVTGLRLLDPSAMGMLFKDMRTNPWHPNVISVFPYVLERPILWTGYLFPFAPTAAALIIVALGWGRQGLGDLFDRMRFWRNGVQWREGALVYAAMAAVYLASVTWLLLVLISREPDSGLAGMLARYGQTPLAIISFMVLALFLGPGGLLEELGWRGFMFPLLVKRLSSPLMACVVLGVLWGLWHFPREIPSILSGNPAMLKGGSWIGFLLNQIQFVAGTIVASILIAFVFFRTGGSVWAAILAHNISNEFSVGLTLFTKSSVQFLGMTMDVDTPIKVALAIIIVVCAGPRLGLKPDAEP
jgi:membrane protease YdiL (CAAX protease family)